jgi:hypothetical protein
MFLFPCSFPLSVTLTLQCPVDKPPDSALRSNGIAMNEADSSLDSSRNEDDGRIIDVRLSTSQPLLVTK